MPDKCHGTKTLLNKLLIAFASWNIVWNFSLLMNFSMKKQAELGIHMQALLTGAQ